MYSNEMMHAATKILYRRAEQIGEDELLIRGDEMYSDNLYHHGILGQKWGVRRYQNEDGSLTPEGVMRYANDTQKSSKAAAIGVGVVSTLLMGGFGGLAAATIASNPVTIAGAAVAAGLLPAIGTISVTKLADQNKNNNTYNNTYNSQQAWFDQYHQQQALLPVQLHMMGMI